MIALVLGLLSGAWAQENDSGMVSLGVVSEAPDYYGIQQGDTLWEISSTFLGNPYYWPELWSINEQVTNPHWIYPGNRIIFRRGTLLNPPELALGGGGTGRDGYQVRGFDYERAPAECGPDARFEGAIPVDQYQSLIFVAKEDDLAVFGHVKKARRRMMMLSERDLIYLQVEDPEAFDCGDVVTIFRKDRIYKNRYFRNQKLDSGELYRIVGDAQIVHRHEDTLAAMVRTSYNDIRRAKEHRNAFVRQKDLVGPYRPVAVELDVLKPKGDLEGHIVSRSTEEKDMISVGDTVFIDRGRADGVRVGNSFYVVEQADELLDQSEPPALHEREDESLPMSVVGRIVVVRVDDDISAAVITDASTAIGVGHHVTQFLK